MPQDLSRTTLQERAHLWARTLGLLGRLVFEGKPSYFGNGEVREHLVLDDHMVELPLQLKNICATIQRSCRQGLQCERQALRGY